MGNFDDVAAVAIHPAIGIARVGNSREAYFIGPEVPGRHPSPAEEFRGRHGAYKRQAAKRQAARFRIFGLDTNGNAICEITGRDATITWAVHLANKKAACYEF